MSNNEQNTRDVSKDPQQVSQPTTATNTGQHWTELSIDPNIKLYIDESICAATTLVISQLSSKYTDSLFDKQRLWNEQLQTNINNSLAQMVRSSMHGGTLTRMDSSSSVDLMDSPQQRQRPSCTSDSPQSMDKGKETVPASGKYPPTPVLNDLIARASKVSIQGQTPPVTAPPTASAPMRSIITPAVVQLFKMTPRKYPSFDYTKFKNMYEVQAQQLLFKHPSQYKAARGITMCEPPILQSVESTLVAVPPRKMPLTAIERDILDQLDPTVFNITTPINVDISNT
ncbi:14216_t:CDS:2 [Gigaspora rosea]|nr:14216_t:CDS:2 [Gigaspora rosea]